MRTILSYTISESQEELFIILMKSRETAVIKVLGKYIHTAFKMREEHNDPALELPHRLLFQSELFTVMVPQAMLCQNIVFYYLYNDKDLTTM